MKHQANSQVGSISLSHFHMCGKKCSHLLKLQMKFSFQLSQRYVVQKPEFINVPAGVLEDLSDQGTDKSVLEAEDAAMGEQADYQVVNVLLILC